MVEITSPLGTVGDVPPPPKFGLMGTPITLSLQKGNDDLGLNIFKLKMRTLFEHVFFSTL